MANEVMQWGDDSWLDKMMSKFNEPFKQLQEALSTPRMDLVETEKGYVASIDLPGIDKKQVQVRPARGGIEVEARIQEEKEHEDMNKYRLERTSKGYYRYFSMPPNANIEKAKAEMKNGVLTISVPKDETKTQTRSIEVS